MKKPFRSQDRRRAAQPAAGRSGGLMQTLRELSARLRKDLDSLRLRVEEYDAVSEPAAAIGQMVFTPQLNTTFLLDKVASGAAGTSSQYVLRDNVTYQIPLVLPPPGLFEGRFLHVMITQRRFQQTSGAIIAHADEFRVPPNVAMSYASSTAANAGGVQTVKWSYAPNRFINFFWNLVDMKSGAQLSDQLLPDMVLLPPVSGAPSLLEGTEFAETVSEPGDVGLELDVPWLFERDAQLAFLFRPITPVVQPSADSGFLPYVVDDREVNNSVRNSAITVQVELHGSRILTEVDAQRAGARVDAERFMKGGFG